MKRTLTSLSVGIIITAIKYWLLPFGGYITDLGELIFASAIGVLGSLACWALLPKD